MQKIDMSHVHHNGIAINASNKASKLRETLTSNPTRACITQRHWLIPMDSMEKINIQR